MVTVTLFCFFMYSFRCIRLLLCTIPVPFHSSLSISILSNLPISAFSVLTHTIHHVNPPFQENLGLFYSLNIFLKDLMPSLHRLCILWANKSLLMYCGVKLFLLLQEIVHQVTPSSTTSINNSIS